MSLKTRLVAGLLFFGGVAGCCHPVQVTCYSVSNPCDPDGIPFYLPKPLLIVSKNFRSIEDQGVGQMGAAPIPNSFDNQAQYADVRANISSSVAPTTASAKSDANGGTPPGSKAQSGAMTNGDTAATTNAGVVPPGSFKDGVTPDTFYTYHIVFVPDLTQKHVIKITGGPGEFRAAMNLVNGWMFTGLGPFYLKDSSTAQNILATGGAITLGGRGVADVVTSLADLSKAAPGKAQTGPFDGNQVAARVSEIQLLMDQNNLRPEPINLKSFAEIYVYEAYVRDGQMEWRPIVEKSFDRQILGIVKTTSSPGVQSKDVKSPGASTPGKEDKTVSPPKLLEQTSFNDQQSSLETTITNSVADRFARMAPQIPGGVPQTGAPGPAPAAGTSSGNNVTVNVNPPGQSWLACCFWPFNLCSKPRPRNVQNVIVAPDGTGISDGGPALPTTRTSSSSQNLSTEPNPGVRPMGG
jgi:hypothetical protein